MWYLRSETEDRSVYFVTSEDKDFIFGRSPDPGVCDYVLNNDTSISRQHAMISIKDEELVIQDLGSKYGTYMNKSIETDENLKEHTKFKLNVNDRIKFGKLNNIWHVCKIALITCSSTLQGETLRLMLDLSKIGVIYKNEWSDDCSYLTMPAITLTIKVVLALVQGSHIVTVDFWNKCSEAIRSQSQLPDPKIFLPPIAEPTLNKDNVSFFPNKRRKFLFNDKQVIFFSRRQLDMYKPVLVATRGLACLLSESKITKSKLCDDNVIVIQYSNNQETQGAVNEIVSYLKSKGRRVVPDAEIGLAILYCSLEKYCNPLFNFTSEVLKQNVSNGFVKEQNVLVQETEDLLSDKLISEKSEMVIQESFLPENGDIEVSSDCNFDVTTSTKRKLSDDTNTVDSHINKKLNTGNNALNGDDMFNFIDNKPSEVQNKTNEKKLNLFKPHKRKNAYEGPEDDLFNFLPDEEKVKPSLTDLNDVSFKKQVNKKPAIETKRQDSLQLDISAIRGSKSKELLENITIWKSTKEFKDLDIVKKECTDNDIEETDRTDLGNIIVIIKNDLLVKSNNFEDVTHNNTSIEKNFKKFKKIWPVKKQVTIIPQSAMSVVTGDSSAIIYDCPLSSDDEVIEKVDFTHKVLMHPRKKQKVK